jgi:hypothetical protein
MDHHTVAAISITGTSLDVLGSLYLAYDLLGGQHGPLRLLTRTVTYSVVFAVGYGLGLGLLFGVASGIATGVTLSVELNRAARGLDHYSLPWEGVFSAIRGAGFAAGLYRIVGLRFAFAFALLITVGQILAYSRGMHPAIDYVAARRPRLTRRQFWGTVIRSIGYIASALICSIFIHHVDRPWVCHSHRAGDRGCDGAGRDGESLHRILCGQSSRTAPGRLWDWPHPLRLCPAIASVLAGVV